MKRFVSFVVLSLVVFGANAANNGRPAMSNKIMAAPRYTASVNQLNGSGVPTKATVVEEEPEIDMREAERNACINNNIGIGNTFVWASRLSDTSNYATMVEDTTNPQNNVCFVRVELKSDDESRIVVSDVPAKYFMWGESIDCGSWADSAVMEKRILDARKGARIGGIVASTVGGAGIGVGAMELFGNKLIDGKVQGQKAKNVDTKTLHVALMKTYEKENNAKYQEIKTALKAMKTLCEQNPNEEYCDTYENLKEFLDK